MPELTSSRLAEEFPGNEWLVADIYDKYRDDPSSVDRKWADIFRRLEGEETTSSTDSQASAPASQNGTTQTSGSPADSQSETKASAGNQRSVNDSTPASATPADPESAQKASSEKSSASKPVAPKTPTTKKALSLIHI